MRVCNQCAEVIPAAAEGCYYLEQWYCSDDCRHAAGDRTGCYGWDGGYTRYSKKRRLLRNHRTHMRIMNDIIEEHGLADELEERLVEETGNINFWLAENEDLEAALRQEIDDKQAFLAGAQCILAARVVATDLERARIQLEDRNGLR